MIVLKLLLLLSLVLVLGVFVVCFFASNAKPNFITPLYGRVGRIVESFNIFCKVIRVYHRVQFVVVFVLMNLFVGSSVTIAAGTKANTLISNTATINYSSSGVPATINSSSSFSVEELLDVSVTWQDATNVNVLSPSTGQITTFMVTNTGNGDEDFILSFTTPNIVPEFNPANVQIWEDTDGDTNFNPVNDTLIPSGNTISLDGGTVGSDARLVFIISDIPAGLNSGEIGNVHLIATSDTANANAVVGNIGAVIGNAGDGGAIDAVVGTNGAQQGINGTYEVIPSAVSITKSAVIADNRGGNNPYPGATIEYTLSVGIAGSNPINNLIITDVIPANTTYNNAVNSIRLNGVLQTNAADSPVDFTSFNTGSNTISVDLSQGGIINIVPPATITITFEVTID